MSTAISETMSKLPTILLIIYLVSPLRVHCGGCNDRCSSGNAIRLPLCYCDPDCGVYGDCCVDRPTCGNGTGNDRPSDFQVSENIVIGYDSPNGFLPASYWMVSACPANWSDPNCSLFQEQCANSSAVLPPVSSPDGIVYKNMYCAACHNVVNFTAWSYVYNCSEMNEFNLSQCELLLFKPPNVSAPFSPRKCTPHIASCLPCNELAHKHGLVSWPDEDYQELVSNCTAGEYSLVSQNHIFYRNKYCAICNGLPAHTGSKQCDLQAVALLSNFTATMTPYMSGVPRIEVRSPHNSTIIQCHGVEEHLSEPVRHICEEIFSFQQLFENCSRYSGSMEKDSNTTFPLREVKCNSVLTLPEQELDDCTEPHCNVTEPDDIIDQLEAVYLIGSSVAILGSLIILITYSLFSEMRTLVGKMLMNLAFAFLILHMVSIIIIIVAPSKTMPLAVFLGYGAVTTIPQGCLAAAQIAYVFFNSARYSWMTVTGFEICRAFFAAWKMRPITLEHRRLFIIYLLIGWGLPLGCATFSISLGYITKSLRRTNQAHYGYASFLLLINVILSVTTMVFLYCASHQRVGKRKLPRNSVNNAHYIRVYVALLSVMGLTSVCGTIIFVSSSVIWTRCLFIFFETLQPFVICIAFVFTKRVGMQYWALLRCKRQKLTRGRTLRSSIIKRHPSVCTKSSKCNFESEIQTSEESIYKESPV